MRSPVSSRCATASNLRIRELIKFANYVDPESSVISCYSAPVLLSENWVSDNTSFLVGSALGVLGILAGAYFYFISRLPKILEWEWVGNDHIVQVAAAQSVKLDVRWNGREVAHPALATLRIANAGKQPISAADVVEPIKVLVAGGEILSVDVVDKPTVDFMDDSELKEDSYFAVVPKLLNPSESFTLQLLLDAERPSLDVTARISGLTRPVRYVGKTSDLKKKKSARFAFGALLFALAAQISGGLIGLDYDTSLGRVITIVIPVISVSVAAFVAGWIRYLPYRGKAFSAQE